MTVHPYDFQDAVTKSAAFSRARKQVVDDYEEALDKVADAKLAHRKARAIAHATAAAEGGTADAKKIRTEELAAEAEHAMEMASGQAKVAKERIDAVADDRAMAKSLIDWSARVNTLGGAEATTAVPDGPTFGARR